MSERLICDSNSGSCKPSEQSGQPLWYQREFENLGKPASNKQASIDTAASYSGLLERVEYVKDRSVAEQLQNGQRQQRGPQDRGHHQQGQQPAPETRVQHRQQRQEVQPPQGNSQVDRRQDRGQQAHVPPERQQIIDAWKQRQAAQEQRVDNRQQGRRDQGDQRVRNDGDIRRHPDGDNRRRPDETQVVRRPHIESPNDVRQQLDPRLLDQRQQQEQQRLAEMQRRRPHDQPGNRQTEMLEQQIRRQLEQSNGRHVDQNLLRQLEQARRQQPYRDYRDHQGLNWTDIQRQRQYLDAQRAYDQRQINPQLFQQMLRNAQRGGGYDDYRIPYRQGSPDYYDPRIDPRIDQRYSYDRRYAYDPRCDDRYRVDPRIDPRYDRYVDPRYDDYARNDWDPRGWDPNGTDGWDPYGRNRWEPYRDRYDPYRDRGRNDIGQQLAATIVPMILGQVFNQIGSRHHHRGGYDRYGGFDRYGGYDRRGGEHDRWGHGRPCPRGGYQSFGRGSSNPLGIIMQALRGF